MDSQSTCLIVHPLVSDFPTLPLMINHTPVYSTPPMLSLQLIGRIIVSFYPTALKSFRGIVFTHGVRMGRWVRGGGGEFVRAVSQKTVKGGGGGGGGGGVCPGCISETVRCRKLIIGRDIG